MLSIDVSANGIYDKLRNEIEYFRCVDDSTLMKEYFENGQDEVWSTVRKFSTCADELYIGA